MGHALRQLSRPVKIRGFLVEQSRCDAQLIIWLLHHVLLQIRLQGQRLAGFAHDGKTASVQTSQLRAIKRTVLACRVPQIAQRQFPAMKT